MTAMLDANTQALIWQVVLEVAREFQIGVITISHDKKLLQRICRSDCLIHKHRIVDLEAKRQPTHRQVSGALKKSRSM